MIRFTLIEIFFLALPLAIFVGYRAFLIHVRDHDAESFSPVPFHKLFVAGGLAALLAFVVVVLSREKIIDQKYIPAHMQDGELIPGGFVERNPDENQGETEK